MCVANEFPTLSYDHRIDLQLLELEDVGIMRMVRVLGRE